MGSPGKGREAFLKEAGELYDAMISRAGPASGDTFDDIEAQGEAAGRRLVLKLLKERLEAEARREAESVVCAKCGRPMRRPKGLGQRRLDTASGTVPYERPHAICDRCGVSFSPAGPAAEDPGAGRISPAPAQGVRGQRRRLL